MLRAVPPGSRVTVRRRLADGLASDVVGTVVRHEENGLVLATRADEVAVAYADVIVHRVIAAVPWRIATFLRGPSALALLDLNDVLGEQQALALVEELTAAGRPVALLTGDEAAATGEEPLEPLILPSTSPLDPVAAHGLLEERCGRALSPPEVRFTSSRVGDLEAARAHGWQGRLFTRP